MPQILLIADDLTGALDSGIKFAKKGLQTLVFPDPKTLVPSVRSTNADVWVVNSDSRGLPPREAYSVVQQIGALGIQWGAEILFKKVDSALRGNVGSELAALVELKGGESICFAPAYPAMRRITCQGIHFIDGKPLAESVFAQDPFNPVCTSYIPDLLRQQTALNIDLIPDTASLTTEILGSKNCIHLFDAASDSRLYGIAAFLREHKKLTLLAGCAGFAEAIAELLSPGRSPCPALPAFERAIVICGSLNRITLNQIAYAEQRGAINLHLTWEKRTNPDYWTSTEGIRDLQKIVGLSEVCPVMIDTQGDDKSETVDERLAVAQSLGMLAKQLMQFIPGSLYVITGGDTLLGTVQQMTKAVLEPVYEVVEGVVLLRIWLNDKCTYIISKSGGFGDENTLAYIFNHMVKYAFFS